MEQQYSMVSDKKLNDLLDEKVAEQRLAGDFIYTLESRAQAQAAKPLDAKTQAQREATIDRYYQIIGKE
jgi:hypothetical protein